MLLFSNSKVLILRFNSYYGIPKALQRQNRALLIKSMILFHAEAQSRREQEVEMIDFSISYPNSATPKIGNRFNVIM
jgi:hypothetical protein